MNKFFIGLMLSAGANTESGIAVLDKDNQIVLFEKFSTMQEIQNFFDNFEGLKESQICISLPWENSMLNGKWRIFSKLYQPVSLNEEFQNVDNWTQRYSKRGCDYFNSLVEQGIGIYRFEMYLTRQALKLKSYFKERSPADCKALQSALRLEYGFSSLPTNMMPMAHLEALVGAILSKNISENPEISKKPIFEFNGIPVIRG